MKVSQGFVVLDQKSNNNYYYHYRLGQCMSKTTKTHESLAMVITVKRETPAQGNPSNCSKKTKGVTSIWLVT